MAMDYTQDSCREFVSALASAAPTPGGGGAAALVGAIGAALGSMVGALTVGKRKYAAVQDEIVSLTERCDALQEALLEQVAGDAESFEPLAKAYAIPKDDPRREQCLEDAALAACGAPLLIMQLCCEALDAIAELAEKGSRLAVSDAGCAAALCKAAMQSASLNVFINTRIMKDREQADDLNARADRMLAKYDSLADGILSTVAFGLRNPEA